MPFLVFVFDLRFFFCLFLSPFALLKGKQFLRVEVTRSFSVSRSLGKDCGLLEESSRFQIERTDRLAHSVCGLREAGKKRKFLCLQIWGGGSLHFSEGGSTVKLFLILFLPFFLVLTTLQYVVRLLIPSYIHCRCLQVVFQPRRHFLFGSGEWLF